MLTTRTPTRYPLTRGQQLQGALFVAGTLAQVVGLAYSRTVLTVIGAVMTALVWVTLPDHDTRPSSPEDTTWVGARRHFARVARRSVLYALAVAAAALALRSIAGT